MDRDSFTYIVTIHNKERLLPRVLEGIQKSARSTSRVILVLDGCTDGSEAIARQFQRTGGMKTQLVFAPDVHEIRSINLALTETPPGYCVILQDDVVLNEPGLEDRLDQLNQEHHGKLGYISFRLAADLRLASWTEMLKVRLRHPGWGRFLLVQDWRHIRAPHGSESAFPHAPYHSFSERMCGIKSPVCLTPALRAVEGFLDDCLAPYCYDDIELSLRSLRHGLKNGLFPIRFESKEEWGGTRQDPQFSSSEGARIRIRNRGIVWRKHGKFIREYSSQKGGR